MRWWWALALLVPLALVALLRSAPDLDGRWENNPAHFWLVLVAALAALAMASALVEAARRRRDARLLLVSLAFAASAGFLGLHALATPGVLVGGKNAGFVVAAPVGLVVAGALAALSALELKTETSVALVRRARLLFGALIAVLVAWAVVSLAELPPLSDPVTPEDVDGPLAVAAAAGVFLYGLAALGYYRIYRRRRARLVFAVTLAFTLLAEALIVVVAALPTSWQVSWWEWHVLMLLGFAFVGVAARQEWHEERFSSLYLEETLRGARDVSVLFADLAGFTPFTESRSPEETHEMINAYFTELAPMIRDVYGGDVHQFIGDQIMAVFNKDGDQPDHAERAARAALALQERAAAIAEGHPDWPRFRAAVNSGEVVTGVVGDRGHRKHGVVGDTVNLGARLEGVARPGEVVIGAGTYERLADGAVVERLPQLEVKGKAAAVDAYVLRSLGA
jgi:adenylate cyclase